MWHTSWNLMSESLACTCNHIRLRYDQALLVAVLVQHSLEQLLAINWSLLDHDLQHCFPQRKMIQEEGNFTPLNRGVRHSMNMPMAKWVGVNSSDHQVVYQGSWDEQFWTVNNGQQDFACQTDYGFLGLSSWLFNKSQLTTKIDFLGLEILYLYKVRTSVSSTRCTIDLVLSFFLGDDMYFKELVVFRGIS